MSYKTVSKCPVCSSRLFISKLKCKKCGTIIENDFEMSKFEYLSQNQLKFIEVFLKNRGNIKDVEKELGISYPTVRSKLDEVINALGYTSEEPAKDKEKIISMLENGKISADQAIEMLKK